MDRFYSKLRMIYNLFMRKVRLVVGLILLVISLAFLIWGLWPAVYESHILPINPSDMTLPTPSSFQLGPLNSPSIVWLVGNSL